MDDFINIIEQLKVELTEDLPGEKAQYKMAPELRAADFDFVETQNYKQSGVLILLYPKSGKTHICFIKRTEYRGPHSGQVSFPGGKYEKEDKNLTNTALREAYEEIGIKPEKVNIIGSISVLKIPVSQMEVLPVVGFVENPPLFSINSIEVEYLIECSIEHLLDTDNKKVMTLFIHNKQIKAPYFACGDEKIWGATAMMLSEFLEIYQQALKNKAI